MKKIVDIGCGAGYRTFQLSKDKHTHVFGIDISAENINLAKKRYPGVSFVQMSAEKMKFKNSFIDCVYAIDVLEHVDNLSKVINEIRRILKPGGKLVIIVPGEVSEKFLLRLRPSYFKEIHHVRIFKENYLEEILNKNGFFLQKKQPRNFFQHIELIYFFKTKKASATQLEIGNWDSDLFSKILHIFVLSFDPFWVFNTPLKYIPIWLFTLPLGAAINFIGNKKMPKSMYYEFIKN